MAAILSGSPLSFLEIELAGVVELLAGAVQDRLGVPFAALQFGCFFQHLLFGRLQDAIEAAEHRKRQNDFAVLRGLVRTAKQVRNGQMNETFR